MAIPIMTVEHVTHSHFPFNVGNVLFMTVRTIDLRYICYKLSNIR